jgi:hypothetical protein
MQDLKKTVETHKFELQALKNSVEMDKFGKIPILARIIIDACILRVDPVFFLSRELEEAPLYTRWVMVYRDRICKILASIALTSSSMRVRAF